MLKCFVSKKLGEGLDLLLCFIPNISRAAACRMEMLPPLMLATAPSEVRKYVSECRHVDNCIVLSHTVSSQSSSLFHLCSILPSTERTLSSTKFQHLTPYVGTLPRQCQPLRLLVWTPAEGLTLGTLHLPRTRRQASVDDETLV